MTRVAKKSAIAFTDERTFIVHSANGRQTLYGPFASEEEAIVRSALTFATDVFLRLYLGVRVHGDVVETPWSIQVYTADEVNYLSANPEEGGYASFRLLSPDRLPLTGEWPSAFRRYHPYTAETVHALLAVMPENAGMRRIPASDWMMAAWNAAGLRPRAI